MQLLYANHATNTGTSMENPKNVSRFFRDLTKWFGPGRKSMQIAAKAKNTCKPYWSRSVNSCGASSSAMEAERRAEPIKIACIGVIRYSKSDGLQESPMENGWLCFIRFCEEDIGEISRKYQDSLEPDNGRDHRAAAIIVASKHAMSAASRASHCYVAITGRVFRCQPAVVIR